MAIKLRANPAPLTGALFVSNPRKKKAAPKRKRKARKKSTRKGQVRTTARRAYMKKRRANALKKTRRNSLALRANRKRRNTRKGQVRKTASRAYVPKKRTNARRRKPTRRKKSTRKGQVRTTARKAYMKRRKNPVRTKILRKNPLQPSFLKGLDNMIGKLPIIGKPLKPVVSPALVGMAGGAMLTVGQHYASKIPYIGQYLVGKYGFAIYGLGMGALAQFLPFKKDTNDMLSIMFAVAGGSINAYQLANQHILPMLEWGGGSSNGNGMIEESGYRGIVMEDMSGAHYGDGGQWEVANFYSDAELNDAHYAGHDLSASEGHAAIMGKGYWCQAFPAPATRAYGQKSSASRYAGKEGHRWGWLVKTLGFKRFQKLAKMKSADRVALIHKLKSVAKASAQKAFDAQVHADGSHITQANTSALGLDMSGLAMDHMAGLAYVGAGL